MFSLSIVRVNSKRCLKAHPPCIPFHPSIVIFYFRLYRRLRQSVAIGIIGPAGTRDRILNSFSESHFHCHFCHQISESETCRMSALWEMKCHGNEISNHSMWSRHESFPKKSCFSRHFALGFRSKRWDGRIVWYSRFFEVEASHGTRVLGL